MLKIPNDREFYEEQYVNLKKSTWEIGKELGCCSESIRKRLHKLGLIRNRNEALSLKAGENHHSWKGENVKYCSLHEWIRKRKQKPEFCEGCRKITDKLELANISGKYRRDIADFRWLCKSCHSKEHPNWMLQKRREIKDNLFKCAKCKGFLPKEAFHKSNTNLLDGIGSYCKSCTKEYAREQYLLKQKREGEVV